MPLGEFYDDTQGWCRTCARGRNAVVSMAERILGSRRAYRASPPSYQQQIRDVAREMIAAGQDFDTAKKREKTDRRGFVYVITNAAWPQYVKIGRAFDPDSRVKGYQTGSPLRDYKLHSSVYFEDCYMAEKEMHLRLQHHQRETAQGEWFHLDPDVAAAQINLLRETI